MDYKKIISMCGLLALIFAPNSWAQTEDVARLVSMLEQFQKQMKEMQQTIDRQNMKISDLEHRPQAQISAAPVAQSEPAPMSDDEFSKRLEGALGGANKWLKDMKFGGDYRLRYEAFTNHGTNAAEDDPRNRFRMRLRYGFEKKFSDNWKMGFSMASGESAVNNGHNGDPTSTNQTFTNLFDFKNIWIEKAYATYTPKWIDRSPIGGVINGVEVTGGKFNNPFEKGSSDMIWDRDVKPEGAYEKINFKLYDSPDVVLGGYATAGQYLLQENGSLTNHDAQMFGYQLGLEPKIRTPFMERPLELLGAISYYDYSNSFSRYNNYKIDGLTSMARNNTVCKGTELCTGYKIWDYYGELGFYPIGKIPVRPFGDFAFNTEAGRSTFDRNAWSLGLKLGGGKKKGDWEASYAYKWIGNDAVVAAFNDSDFGYRGYTGSKGHVFKLGYNLTDYLALNGSAYLVENLDANSVIDFTGSTAVKNEMQKRFQVDMVWKF